MRKVFKIIFILLFFPMAALARSEEAVLQSVPFTAQAPTGRWSDQRQQDACEEASALMAVKWARGEKLDSDRKKVEKEIVAIADWEKKKYGTYRDTSASSTGERILKNYFSFFDFDYRENITKKDIIKELEKNNIIIAPMNGKKLKNPYFSRGGPERHMVLVIGYDYGKKEFIANDTGTRRGANYRYKEDILYSAIRDYPTGDHELIKKAEKNILVIKKSSK